ncbi:hypothetical protein HHK36_020340 [Tetracentron sinense]|uniref:Disease resistance R13L4/SHOC-2-like LRR domain-containing protein n=1 Tax=Tetracentron sinense TaxID=13715 RepID=A0A834YRF5_TETSI|nr:hypothetical protein HHK36_020340 [Tetracentron sinense]
MSNLRSLHVKITKGEVLDLQFLSSPPLLLQRLDLVGALEKFPNWISSLHNLKGLHLEGSKLRDDPLEVLQALPNLVKLVINNTYDGEEMCFKAGGFPALKYLQLCKFERLKLVRVEDGAKPHLEELTIVEFKMLEKVPLGLEFLANLKFMDFAYMPNEFATALNPTKIGGGYQGEPAIFLTPDESSKLANPLKLSLVAKCSYGRPAFPVIREFFKKNFHLKFYYHIGVIDPRHLLIRFVAEEDFLTVYLKEYCYINEGAAKAAVGVIEVQDNSGITVKYTEQNKANNAKTKGKFSEVITKNINRFQVLDSPEYVAETQDDDSDEDLQECDKIEEKGYGRVFSVRDIPGGNAELQRGEKLDYSLEDVDMEQLVPFKSNLEILKKRRTNSILPATKGSRDVNLHFPLRLNFIMR